MKIKSLIIPLIAVILAFFVGSSFFLVRYDKVYAEEPTPQFTIGAGEMSIGTPTALTYFNNGYSFVFYGTFSNNANSNFSFTTPTLNFGTNFLSMRVNFSNSNVNNNLTVLNVHVFGYIFADNIMDEIYTLNGVNATSLNSYFNGKLITVGKSYDKISFSFEVAVNSGYVEFAFNDFSIDFFSDFKLAYEEGFQDGYDTAKEEYYQSRYDLGYNAGFIEGSNNEFSFLSYFGAIIETPINAALSLFNFDFLGFNMRSFFLSVLTISMIVMIVKFVLAR